VTLPPRRPRFPAVATPAPAPTQRPQRPVREADDHARRARPATGLGLDSEQVRARMVDRLRREQGISCEPLLAAMAAVPRHRFVDPALATQAYEDTALPIGHGQTISSPSVVAIMIARLFATDAAQRRGNLGRTLEIGTGCGYQAALLAQLAPSVISIERLRPLYDKARELLAGLPRANLRLVYGDGRLGHPPNAPYDSIIAAAGGDELPQAWLDQLAIGGRLIAPVTAGRAQALVVVDRTPTEWRRALHEAVMFVPLRSGTA
jgi:protein-L-isoaspartate(D-aspartate) O-methyltransferase